jgi:peroxiredoxin
MLALLVLTLGVTPRDQYESLLKQYDAPIRVYVRDPERARAACAPFLKLAREYPGDPAALDALHWVVTHTLGTPDAGEAMDLLAQDHITSPQIGPICCELDGYYGAGFKPLEQLLRAALRDNPHRDVQGVVTFALARRLKRDRENAICERLHFECESKGRIFEAVPKPRLTALELDGMRAESEALYQRVIEQFGDVKPRSEAVLPYMDVDCPLGDAARIELPLSIGRIAPEIEGEDLDGKHFKLSDYRGKVVVLNFWNQGCTICRESYPDERAMLKRMEGQPFVMLGINSGDSPETLRRLRANGDVTWRFWVDGKLEESKISKNWNVRGWPTIVVLDRNGVIRYQGKHISLRLPLMEYAAETLIGSE